MLLAINDDSIVGVSAEKAEACLKGLPRGLFRLTVMAPFKDVTGEHPAPVSTVNTADRAVSDSATADAAGTGAPPATQCDKENIVEETLQHSPGSSLGFQIEGGSDTPLKYIYIKSLIRDSPAFNCGRFNDGDQLVMFGDTCFIGLSYAEATHVLDVAPATVKVVAQRKVLPTINLPQLSVNDQSPPDSKLPDDFPPTESIDRMEGSKSSEGVIVQVDRSGAPETMESAGSTEDLLASEDSVRPDKPHERKVSLIPEEKMTVELTRHPGEKLGIGIVGGIDNPNLRHIHVSLASVWYYGHNGGYVVVDSKTKCDWCPNTSPARSPN